MVVAILKGSFVFAADLIRALHGVGLAPEVDFMTLSSYRKARISGGQVSILRDMDLDVRGRNVLIIDDVLEFRPHARFRQGPDRGPRGQVDQDLRAARQAGAAGRARSSRTIAPSNVPIRSSSATAWTSRTATANCRSSGASCANDEFNGGRCNGADTAGRRRRSTRDLVRRALEADGHSVVVTQDGSEALERLKQAGAAFDVLVSDVEMPLLDGVTLAERAFALQPKVRVLLMSGFAEQLDRAKT